MNIQIINCQTLLRFIVLNNQRLVSVERVPSNSLSPDPFTVWWMNQRFSSWVNWVFSSINILKNYHHQTYKILKMWLLKLLVKDWLNESTFLILIKLSLCINQHFEELSSSNLLLRKENHPQMNKSKFFILSKLSLYINLKTVFGTYFC